MTSNRYYCKMYQNLNCEEKKAVEEFEKRVKNILPPTLSQDETLYYRFLKARDFDVDKAEKMLLKTINWRKANQVDTFLEDFKPREFFVKHIYPTVLCHDKTGDLVVYSPYGRLDAKDLLKGIKFNELMMNTVWFGEKCLAALKEENKKTGRDGYRMSFIIDLDELTLSNATAKVSAELLLTLIQIAQDNYPERLKTIHIINAPSYYMIVYSIVKAVMSKAMLKKFNSFGRSGWKEHLLESIDSDLLPAFLGGNRTDPDGDPRCNTFVKKGGKVPPIDYLSEEERYFKCPRQVKKALIPAMEKKDVYIDVTENGSRIQWQFMVRNKDIGLKLSFQIPGHHLEEILPLKKISTPDGTEEGSYKCQSIGTYILTFDNTYSWMSSKDVEYHVTVVKDK